MKVCKQHIPPNLIGRVYHSPATETDTRIFLIFFIFFQTTSFIDGYWDMQRISINIIECVSEITYPSFKHCCPNFVSKC